MAIQISAAILRRILIGTVFIFVAVSVSGAAWAQQGYWPQQGVPQQYQAAQPYQGAQAYRGGPQYQAAPPRQTSQPQQAYIARPGITPVANYAPAAYGTPSPQMYATQAQTVPAAAYQASAYQPAAVQPYYVASRTTGMAQNQYPVTPVENGASQMPMSQQQQAPVDQWSDPAAQGNVGYNSGYCGGNGYDAGNCGVSNYCCPPPVRWFGSAGVLMLDRDDENHRFYSYDSANEAYQLLDSQETNFDWASGVEAHVGRMDMCSCTGCEAVYWGLYPDQESAYAYPYMVTGDLNGIFNFDQLDYNGQPASNYVDGAEAHRLYRTTELHNVEFNHIWNCGGCCSTSCCSTGCDSCCDPCCNTSGGAGCCGGRGLCGGHGCGGCGGQWTFGVLTGFRYLRFEDNLSFASDPNDTAFTGEVDELYYNIDCDNDLWGWQFGGFGERSLGCSGVSFTFGAKAGVFLNDADAHSTIGGAAGLATINNGPNQGVAWDIESSDDCMATIAELQAGVAWAFCPTWRVRGDYRVIGISGVAMPTNQIYQDLRGIQDVALISANGDLILHGVFVGVERTY